MGSPSIIMLQKSKQTGRRKNWEFLKWIRDQKSSEKRKLKRFETREVAIPH